MDKLQDNSGLIKCLFLPVGETNLKSKNGLSSFLVDEYGVSNEPRNDMIYINKFLILGTQEQLNSEKFTHKEVDLINFLADNIYYGVVDTNNNNNIMGKYAFKKTSYYKNYFCWMPLEHKKFKLKN